VAFRSVMSEIRPVTRLPTMFLSGVRTHVIQMALFLRQEFEKTL
jgi:hypothetical protein